MPSATPPRTEDLNRVLVSGILADEPDLYDLAPAPTVCFLRLHCNRHDAPHHLGDEGQLEVNVLLLGAYATNLSNHLHTGRRRLAVDGTLASAHPDDPDQNVCVIAERIELLDPPGAPRPVEPAAVGFSDDAWF